MSKAIILLSGGLDSLVALNFCIKHTNYDIKIALTFDYGQKAANSEIKTSFNICKYYNIEHKVIKLDWLKEITNTSLVSNNMIPTSNFSTKNSAEAVWVPNRNGLFLNIAASFCDSYKFKHIIFGANKEEADIFPDNTEEFRKQLTKSFKTSTLVKPIVVAPLINYTKDDIVKIAIEDSAPLELVRSCYNSGERHCGECESCFYLKQALIKNNCKEYLKILFDYYDEN